MRETRVLAVVVVVQLALLAALAHHLLEQRRADELVCAAALDGVRRDLSALLQVEMRTGRAGAAARAVELFAGTQDAVGDAARSAPRVRFVDVGASTFVPPPEQPCTVFAATDGEAAAPRIHLSQHRGDGIASVTLDGSGREAVTITRAGVRF